MLNIRFNVSLSRRPNGIWAVESKEIGSNVIAFHPFRDAFKARQFYTDMLFRLHGTKLWKITASGEDPVKTYTIFEWNGNTQLLLPDLRHD